MASVLESMGVEIDDKEIAMAVLNGLPARYQPIITALDAIGDEDASFNLEKVRSRLLQEETRSSLRIGSAPNSSTTALFNRGYSNARSKNGKEGHKAIFDETGVSLVRNELTLARGSLNCNLYEMNTVECHTGKESAFMSNMQLWHERFGHVHNNGIINMARKGIVKGLKLATKRNEDQLCEGCITGKMPRAAIPKASSSKVNNLLELIHTDISEQWNSTPENLCIYAPAKWSSRKNEQNLKRSLRSMLHHKAIDNDFWAEALATATYIRNRVTSRGIPISTTPYEI
eukprot:IDg22598t1